MSDILTPAFMFYQYVKSKHELTIRVKKWLVEDKGLLSPLMRGVCIASTTKAILFEGCAPLRFADTCMRCGLEIRNPISKFVGYGPVCSDFLGIPRPEKYSPEMFGDVEKRLAAKTQFKGWLPISQIEVVD